VTTAVITGAASGMGRACVDSLRGLADVLVAVDLKEPDIDGTIGVACDVTDPAAVQALVERVRDLGPFRALAEAGAAVVLADLNADGAEHAAELLTKEGFQATSVRVDITDPASTDAMVEHAVSTFGGVDILVNNAALMTEIPMVDVLELTPEWFDRVMRVNVFGALSCSRAAKPAMVGRGGGRVINQASAGAFMAGGIYGASKLALVSLTASLARSLGPLGINVNGIAPGLVENEPGLKT